MLSWKFLYITSFFDSHLYAFFRILCLQIRILFHTECNDSDLVLPKDFSKVIALNFSLTNSIWDFKFLHTSATLSIIHFNFWQWEDSFNISSFYVLFSLMTKQIQHIFMYLLLECPLYKWPIQVFSHFYWVL